MTDEGQKTEREQIERRKFQVHLYNLNSKWKKSQLEMQAYYLKKGKSKQPNTLINRCNMLWIQEK